MYIWWFLKFLVFFCGKLTKPCRHARTTQLMSQQSLASVIKKTQHFNKTAACIHHCPPSLGHWYIHKYKYWTKAYLPVYPDNLLCYTIISPSGFSYLFLALKFKFKKSICQCLSSLFSNAFRLSAVIMSSVRLFHKFVILKLKKLFWIFSLEYDLVNFKLCPSLFFIYRVVNTVLQLNHTFYLQFCTSLSCHHVPSYIQE